MNMRRSKGRQKFLGLAMPNPNLSTEIPDRDSWIDETHKNFVSPSKANKAYYRIILEQLWPQGHGIPGPIINQDVFRSAIDEFRKKRWTKSSPYRPYIDVFRRLRELQGEEGLTGIAREGNKYQLVDLELSDKRIPRIHLSNEQWEGILKNYDFTCAVCGRKEEDSRFDQDHKVPRVRGGQNSLSNWQPLCHECNNFKSTACRGCELDCEKCPWAYPEKYALIRLSADNTERIRNLANKDSLDPSVLLNTIVNNFLE